MLNSDDGRPGRSSFKLLVVIMIFLASNQLTLARIESQQSALMPAGLSVARGISYGFKQDNHQSRGGGEGKTPGLGIPSALSESSGSGMNSLMPDPVVSDEGVLNSHPLYSHHSQATEEGSDNSVASLDKAIAPSESLLRLSDNGVVVSGGAIILQGDRNKLLEEAGINKVDWPHVEFIFQKESGWDYKIWSKVDSRSYGLGQANLMVHEVPDGFMDDPVVQIKWFDSYAKERYGSWAKARKFWEVNNYW